MKTCPFLWRQSEAPTSGLLEKSADLDGAGPPAGRGAAGDCTWIASALSVVSTKPARARSSGSAS